MIINSRFVSQFSFQKVLSVVFTSFCSLCICNFISCIYVSMVLNQNALFNGGVYSLLTFTYARGWRRSLW